jgi:hypothetical protein
VAEADGPLKAGERELPEPVRGAVEACGIGYAACAVPADII